MTLVQLPAADLKNTVRFYADILGLSLDDPERPIVGNTFLSTVPRIGPGLHIIAASTLEFRHLHRMSGESQREYVALYAKSITVLFERLQQAGTPIVSAPADGYMTFLDPEGHLVGVYERADFEINDQFQSNITGFRYVPIEVEDIAKSIIFYEKALGLRREASLLSTDSKECYLSFKEGSQNQPLIRIIQSPNKTIQPMHWMLDGSPKHAMELHARDIRALKELLLEYGAKVPEELEFTECGGYLKFYTPEGHYIWVNQNRSYCDY